MALFAMWNFSYKGLSPNDMILIVLNVILSFFMLLFTIFFEYYDIFDFASPLLWNPNCSAAAYTSILSYIPTAAPPQEMGEALPLVPGPIDPHNPYNIFTVSKWCISISLAAVVTASVLGAFGCYSI